MNYEDSNVNTVYPSFNTLKAIELVDPEKELSIILAKINYIIDESPYTPNNIPYEELKQYISKSWKIIRSDPKLQQDFLDFYLGRLNKVIKEVVVSSLFNRENNTRFTSIASSENARMLIELLKVIFVLNNPAESSYKQSIVSDEVTILLLSNFKATQIDLLQQLHSTPKPGGAYISEKDIVTKENSISKKHTKRFGRRKSTRSQIYSEIVLVNKLLTMIGETCNPTYQVFDYFKSLADHHYVINASTFCFEINLLMIHLQKSLEEQDSDTELLKIKSCLKSIINQINRTPEWQVSGHNSEFSKLLILYQSIFHRHNFVPVNGAAIELPGNEITVVKCTHKRNNITTNHYRYHLVKQAKEPEWVKNFYSTRQLSTSSNLKWSSDETLQNETPTSRTNCSTSIIDTPVENSNLTKPGFRAKIKGIIPSFSLVKSVAIKKTKRKFAAWRTKGSNKAKPIDGNPREIQE
ncbi:Piso0_004887 [Millerozyma farinosa CBS 7064]|uniref:Piso0_004887 protein n=1 Tax=Pichia sorbitophila (strain ATCC MYA-4447 / BCRC 22081 / CBS 7064 / NBRC 10061 / NRRL Y-12695) TaxID=559304 RepID=G8Y0P7_PICSO|nr:Piso0_004887 [Millerozyma farinosa CBS 7064]